MKVDCDMDRSHSSELRYTQWFLWSEPAAQNSVRITSCLVGFIFVQHETKLKLDYDDIASSSLSVLTYYCIVFIIV
jgi:hypothetical protein